MADQDETPTLFEVDISQDGDSTVVSFLGELDISTAEDMRRAFLHPDMAKASAVQVDLAQVSFLDSSAIGILVAACKQVRKVGGDFSVRCDTRPIRLVLELSGLIEYLQVQGIS